MRPGRELARIEAAARDDHEYVGRPNVCVGERMAGRVVKRGGKPVFAAEDGAIVPFGPGQAPAHRWDGRRVEATVVMQVGLRQRAWDPAEVDRTGR